MLTTHDIAQMLLNKPAVKLESLSKTSSYTQPEGSGKIQIADDLRIYLSAYPVGQMTPAWMSKYHK